MMKNDNLKLALKVHSELTKLVQPSTPESIRSSIIRHNPTLKFIIFAGFISFILFLIPLLHTSIPPFVQIIGAAGLGITFQSLYTAHKYLKNSTYNPAYNQAYLINFALGLFAGSILGLFGQELFPAGSSALNYQPNALALVGGFSAEAVAQILQRVSDTLVTAVRGTQKDKSEADANKKITQNSSKIAAQLSKSINGDPEELKGNVEKVVQGLLEKN